MDFTTGAALLSLCEENGWTIAQAMLQRETEQAGTSRETVRSRLGSAYDVMRRAVRTALTEPLRSMGGLIGGEAQKMQARRQQARPACGETTAKAVCYAMGVLEVNASMGLIVAAPTAGSSGVIPGVFLALQEEFGFSDGEMTDALLCAGAVGYIITRNATVAGAEGGCQAEVGTAAAMAAAAATQLLGGTPQACLAAAALALSNLLGLVCDPMAGLVEAPCQTRNAIGASNALISAEIALSGISSLIPFDEMVEAMRKVGASLPPSLRETAQGGCAATPTGCALCKKIYESRDA